MSRAFPPSAKFQPFFWRSEDFGFGQSFLASTPKSLSHHFGCALRSQRFPAGGATTHTENAPVPRNTSKPIFFVGIFQYKKLDKKDFLCIFIIKLICVFIKEMSVYFKPTAGPSAKIGGFAKREASGPTEASRSKTNFPSKCLPLSSRGRGHLSFTEETGIQIPPGVIDRSTDRKSVV